jgi:hypothetical protein
MFCTKVPVHREATIAILHHSVHQTRIEPLTHIAEREVVWVINYDKVAYWAERLLRIECPRCEGTGQVEGKRCQTIRGGHQSRQVIERGCGGRKTIPMHTAWTLGKIQYALQLQAKRKHELAKGRDLVEVDMGDHTEVISMPRAKEQLVFDFDLASGRISVDNRPIKGEEWDQIPTAPRILTGDVVVGDYETAKMLIECMRGIERKAERGQVKLRPFYGMDALFERMYHDNEVEPEGVYLRGDPHQIARQMPETMSRLEHREFATHAMLRIIANYERYAEDMAARIVEDAEAQE